MTEEQKSNVVGIVRYGCDRVTAAGLAGVRREDLDEALARDDGFECDLAKAEAQAEFRHMRAVHQAAEDPKNWRTSVWWLEQRSRRRGDGDDPTMAHVLTLVDALTEVLMSEIKENEVQKRVLERLAEVVYGREEDAPQTTQILQIADQTHHDGTTGTTVKDE